MGDAAHVVERFERDINGERRAVVRVAAGGRVIEAVRLDMAEQWDFLEIAGREVDNEAWMNTGLLAASVIAIDGVPEPCGAKSREQLRRILKRIGEAGVDALCAAFDESAAPDSATEHESMAAAGN